MTGQIWRLSHRADPAAKRLADRHYNRQKPESPQFAPPGSCLVLLTERADAFWITSNPLPQFVRHAWAGALVCSAFRSEGDYRASEMIRAALAATRSFYGEPPDLGMITFIDRSKVRPVMVRGEKVWGWTWRKAGFVEAGETKGGLLAMQMHPAAMPAPRAALPRSMAGTPLFDGQAAFEATERGRAAFEPSPSTRTGTAPARQEPRDANVPAASPSSVPCLSLCRP